MPRPSPEPERTLRAAATHKRRAAERREAEALKLRAEAAELERRWDAYVRERGVTGRAAS
jgi:hypothetical protein